MSSTVSVIIPSYNHAHFVAAAIKSAQAQTYPNLEIIVVDDGSKDNTAQVVAEFGSSVHYIYQENQGLSAARNTGIRYAHGEFIALLDSDDLWLPNYVEAQVKNLQQNPRAGLSYSWWSHIDQDGQPMPEPGHYNQRGNLLMELALMNHFPPVAVMVRKQCIEEAGYFDEKLFALEDWDLWLRISANSWEIDFVPRVLAQYRRHNNNMTLDVARMERNQLAVLNKLEASSVASQVGALIPQARANVYLNSALSHHLQNQTEASYQSLVKAIEIWPPLVTQKATWYRWICADQPPGYQDTQHFKDLNKAAERIDMLLERLSADTQVASIIWDHNHEIQRIVNLNLVHHYYLASNGPAARRRLLNLMRQQPELLIQPQATQLFVKSLMGRPRVENVRRLLARFR